MVDSILQRFLRWWRRHGAIAFVAVLGHIALSLFASPVALARGFTTPRWLGPVSVVDLERGVIVPDLVMQVEDGRLLALIPAHMLPDAAKAALIPAPGPYATAGLWDMHGALTRYAPKVEYPAQLAYGVTRIRSIVSCPKEGAHNVHPCVADVSRWNDAVHSGDIAGPMVMGTGTFPMNGADRQHADLPASAAMTTADEARRFVREFSAQTVRPAHIKSYDGLPLASFLALLDEANQLGIEVSGHVPVAVPVAAAARAGLKAIAHARSLPIGCSSQEDQIIRMRVDKVARHEWMKRALDTQSEAVCHQLWRTLKAQGTYVSPTLVTRYNETFEGIQALAADAETKALIPWVFEYMWGEDRDEIKARSPVEEQVYRDYFLLASRLVADAQRAGVLMLVGSDTFDTFMAPGVGIHQEMQLWQRAGIANVDILRAATSNAARYFGLEHTHGKLAPGYVADVVFSDANPLETLAILRRPAAVMQAGRLHSRGSLDALAALASSNARSWGYTTRLLFDWVRSPLRFMK